MLIWQYKKYKGLYIPEVLDQPKFNLVTGNRCCMNIGNGVPNSKLDCFEIDCSDCVYGVRNLSVSLDYLIELDFISKEEALDFTLTSIDIIEYDKGYEE